MQSKSSSGPSATFGRQIRLQSTALLLLIGFLFAMQPPSAEAKPGASSISVVPTITSITASGGQLLASGTATAVVKGKTYTSAFSGVPVDIALAPDQTGAGACPVLDLTLGPITLDLLGLVVETSPICLTITAYDNGGLLGDLLCSVANLLNGGLSLSQILAGQSLVDPLTGTVLVPGLTSLDLSNLLAGLQNLLNGALGNLLQSVITAITTGSGHTCAILHLELGPLDLNLLGLQVVLDDCSGGPVVVDVTAVTGKGKLLGNLLCELLDGGLLNLGTTLGSVLNQILGLLSL